MSDDVVERARAVLRNDPGACTAETVAELLNEIEALRAAIEESVCASHKHDDGNSPP